MYSYQGLGYPVGDVVDEVSQQAPTIRDGRYVTIDERTITAKVISSDGEGARSVAYYREDGELVHVGGCLPGTLEVDFQRGFRQAFQNYDSPLPPLPTASDLADDIYEVFGVRVEVETRRGKHYAMVDDIHIELIPSTRCRLMWALKKTSAFDKSLAKAWEKFRSENS